MMPTRPGGQHKRYKEAGGVNRTGWSKICHEGLEDFEKNQIKAKKWHQSAYLNAMQEQPLPGDDFICQTANTCAVLALYVSATKDIIHVIISAGGRRSITSDNSVPHY